MKTRRKTLSEEQIDQLIISQANNDSAWEDPVKVTKRKPTSLSLPAVLAAELLSSRVCIMRQTWKTGLNVLLESAWISKKQPSLDVRKN